MDVKVQQMIQINSQVYTLEFAKELRDALDEGIKQLEEVNGAN